MYITSVNVGPSTFYSYFDEKPNLSIPKSIEEDMARRKDYCEWLNDKRIPYNISVEFKEKETKKIKVFNPITESISREQTEFIYDTFVNIGFQNPNDQLLFELTWKGKIYGNRC